MADKYCDVSATYNGDGTSSAQAASDGATGAWNSFTEVFGGTPSYGSISDGDVIHYRTHDGSSDLGVTLSANISSNAGIITAPVIHLFDDGTAWANDGTFTITYANYTVTISSHSKVVGIDQNLYLDNYTATLDGCPLEVKSRAEIRNFKLRTCPSNSGSVRRPVQIGDIAGLPGIVVNPYFEFHAYDTGDYGLITLNANYSSAIIINPTINMTNLPNISAIILFAYRSDYYGWDLTVLGGKIIGAQDLQHLCRLPQARKSQVISCGFDPGPINTTLGDGIYQKEGLNFSMSNIPGTIADFIRATYQGDLRWREGQNYPTLNAVLPDASNTSWSYRVYPKSANSADPMVLPTIVKHYNLTAATKTITVEMLLSEDLPVPDKSEVYVEVMYIDSSDNNKNVSSYEVGSTLDTSTAGWSSTFYGAKNYDKYKLEVTTPTSIKQNTDIYVQVIFGVSATDTSDFFFVDPEVTLS